MKSARLVATAAALLAVAGIIGAPDAAAAQEAIEIELNRVEDAGDGCRITTVFTNRLGVTIDRLVVEIAVFDQGGRVEDMFVLPSRPLSPGKIGVRRFGLGGLACGEIGQILFNHVTVCEGQGLDPETCSGAVALSNRTEVAFVSTALAEAADEAEPEME